MLLQILYFSIKCFRFLVKKLVFALSICGQLLLVAVVLVFPSYIPLVILLSSLVPVVMNLNVT
jgi:hypothetical protein